MFPVVWRSPPVALLFLVHCCVCSIGGLDQQLSFKVFKSYFVAGLSLFHACHIWVLGGQVIGIFYHLSSQVHVGSSEFSHFRPVLHCSLRHIRKIFLYNDKVVGSVAALASYLLTILESYWASIKWAWKAVQYLFSCVLHIWQSSG